MKNMSKKEAEEYQKGIDEGIVKEEKIKIEHLTCAICGENITYFDGEDILSSTHFDISRSKKEFEIVEDSVEEIEGDDPNIKMKYSFCKKCFDKILNESKTLGSLFFNKELGTYIY